VEAPPVILLAHGGDGINDSDEKRVKAVRKSNLSETERLKTRRKVNMKKHPLQRFWDRIFPSNY
jgi:hypothetical protein